MPRDRGVRHASRKRGLQLLYRGGAARAVGRRRRDGDARGVAGLYEGREPSCARGLGTARAGSVSSATTWRKGTAEVLSVNGTRRGGRVSLSSGPSRGHHGSRHREKYRTKLGFHVIARTSTLVAEEPATRRRETCVAARVRMLSAGSVHRSTRLIGVKGSGRTRNRARPFEKRKSAGRKRTI